jgi:hypothetical protein
MSAAGITLFFSATSAPLRAKTIGSRRGAEVAEGCAQQ